ncbi:MAG: hypothetical protein WA975_14935 [Mesorhizobium sp.]
MKQFESTLQAVHDNSGNFGWATGSIRHSSDPAGFSHAARPPLFLISTGQHA